MKYFLAVILLSVLAAGCISLQQGADYELPGLNNTTIFYLNGSSIQVVESVTNATSARFSLGEGGELNIRNPIAVDYSGSNVAFNVSKEVVFGRSFARFDFNSPFSGFVAFTRSDGQDFSQQLTKNGSVRVILPVNFSTGSRFLGIPDPKPDKIVVDASGREVLIWENPYPGHGSISVRYYHKSALSILFYFFIILLVCVLLVSGYYYVSLRALKKKRERMERGIGK